MRFFTNYSRSTILLTITVLLGASLSAQDLLTLDRAIKIGLKNNYTIRTAKNESEIAANNNSPGNAGMLPSIDANGSGSKSQTSSKQEYITGETIDRTGAKSTSYNAGVALNWTIFDGLDMFITKKKLSELKSLGEASARQAVENSVAQIVDAYYNIVRQQQTLQVLQEAKTISQDRMNIAQTKQKLGSGSGLEYMQAKADYNADQSALLKQQAVVSNARVELNRLLARDVNTAFTVSDTIPLISSLQLDALQQKATDMNSALRQVRLQKQVAQLNIKSLQAQRFPQIGVNLGYNYSHSESQSGFLLSNQSRGLNYGLSVQFNLFNGFNQNRQIQNARISAKNSEIQLSQLKTQLDALLKQAYENYQNSLQLVELEQENKSVARNTVNIATEKYRLGSITPLELKEAQRTYIQAESRLVDARYQTKSAETELLRLSGQMDRVIP